MNNESLKLKKQVEISEVNFGSIIPNLVYVIFEKHSKDSPEPEIKTLQTFQELRQSITEAVEDGSNVKLEVHFVEEQTKKKGKIIQKKSK